MIVMIIDLTAQPNSYTLKNQLVKKQKWNEASFHVVRDQLRRKHFIHSKSTRHSIQFAQTMIEIHFFILFFAVDRLK